MHELSVMLMINCLSTFPEKSSGLTSGKIYFENASANVLSYDLVVQLYTIKWNQTKHQFSFNTDSGQQFVFKRRGDLFVFDFSFLFEK